MKKILLLCSVCSFLIFPQNEKTDIMNISLDSLLSLPVQSASKFFQNISDAPASVTIITSDDIEYYGYRTLGELLQFVRSFYISNDKNYSYTGVRGFSRPTDYNDRILLLINGHRLNESIYGSAFIGSELAIDLSMIDRIEIVRGPGSVLYGTNAMFAIINIIAKKASQVAGVRVAAEYGSLQHKKAVLNFGKEYENGLELNISGNFAEIKGEDIYFEEFDTDSTNKGIALNQDKENYFSVFNSLKYKNFTFQGFYSGRTKYIPTASYSTVFNGNTKTKDGLAFAQISYTVNLYENTELFLRTYYDHYLYEGYYPYEDNSEVYDSFDESIGNQLGGEAQLTWNILSNDIIVIGTEYQNSIDATYTFWEDESEISGGNYPYQNFSFYLNNEYKPFKNLALITGIRGEKHSGIKLSIIPRVGIIYGLNSTTFKLLYGKAFRAPNVYERNYEDSFLGQKISQGLQHEKIKTAEFIVEHKFGKNIFSTVTVFQNTVNNLIDTQLDEADSLYQFVNLNNTKASGVELELQLYTFNNFKNYLNYTFQSSKDIESDTKLSNAPEQVFNMGSVYNFSNNLSLAAELHYETRRKTVYDSMTSPFFIANLNMIIKPLSDDLSFALKINNVFDKKYKVPGGFEHIQAAIPQPGRTFILKIGYTF